MKVIKSLVRAMGLVLATVLLLGWITVAKDLDILTNVIVLILAIMFLAISFQD